MGTFHAKLPKRFAASFSKRFRRSRRSKGYGRCSSHSDPGQGSDYYAQTWRTIYYSKYIDYDDDIQGQRSVFAEDLASDSKKKRPGKATIDKARSIVLMNKIESMGQEYPYEVEDIYQKIFLLETISEKLMNRKTFDQPGKFPIKVFFLKRLSDIQSAIEAIDGNSHLAQKRFWPKVIIKIHINRLQTGRINFSVKLFENLMQQNLLKSGHSIQGQALEMVYVAAFNGLEKIFDDPHKWSLTYYHDGKTTQLDGL